MGEGMLAGKVAIVTGSGRGIGREIALAMSDQGAAVVVNDVGASLTGEADGATPGEDVAAEITSRGGRAVVSTESVSEWSSAQKIVQAAMDTFGHVDIVVNNAGILRDAMFFKMTPDDFDAVINVHLRGAFNVSRAAVDCFRERQIGCYLHMTSAAGLVGNIGQANYMAAKMGIVGLSRALSQDLQRYNIRSNCISPFAKTRMLEGGRLTQEQRAVRDQKIATWKIESIATLAVALASDECKDISGQIFGARGGEVFVYSQPRPLRSVHKDGGWTPEGLAKLLPRFSSVFSPLSEMGSTWDSVDSVP